MKDLITLSLTLALSGQAYAGCNSNITLVRNGAPAFTPVASIIYSDKGEFVLAENRHSYNASLTCGENYTLVSGERSRTFAAGATPIVLNIGE